MTPAPQTPVTPTGVRAPAPAAASNAPARTAKTDGMKFNALGDKTRDKCAELMYDALALDSDQRASARTRCFAYAHN
jgi:transcription elongation factor S-II